MLNQKVGTLLLFVIICGCACSSFAGLTIGLPENKCIRFYTKPLDLTIDEGLVALALVEQTENPRYKQSSELQKVPFVLVDTDQVVIRKSSEINAHVLDFLFTQDKTVWPRNPIQESDRNVPYSERPPEGFLPTLLSASRTLFFSINGHWYSMKLPKKIPGEYGKDDLRNSVKISLLRSKAIEKIDALIGKDPELIMLLDIISLADKESGNGWVIRDLGPLQDGDINVPGFAKESRYIKYAKAHHLNLPEVIDEYFSKLMARSLAKIFLRYGLIITAPHDQNYLSRFYKKNGKPKLQIAWRDLSDSKHFLPVLDAIGLSEIKEETLAQHYEHAPFIQLHHMSNTWFLDSFHSENPETIKLRIHDEFFRFIYTELGQKFTPLDFNEIILTNYLTSRKGQKAIKNYHLKLRQQYLLRTPASQVNNKYEN